LAKVPGFRIKHFAKWGMNAVLWAISGGYNSFYVLKFERTVRILLLNSLAKLKWARAYASVKHGETI
jgi:hypothetical protein